LEGNRANVQDENIKYRDQLKETQTKSIIIRQLINICVDQLGASVTAPEANITFIQFQNKLKELTSLFQKTARDFSTAPILEALVVLSSKQDTYVDKGILDKLVRKLQELEDRMHTASADQGKSHDTQIEFFTTESETIVNQIRLLRKTAAECFASLAGNREMLKRTLALNVRSAHVLDKKNKELTRWSNTCDLSLAENACKDFIKNASEAIANLQ
jgi:hypothetical protein